MTTYVHQPVLQKEVLENLKIDPKGFYIDATFGRGGHSREILRQLSIEGQLLAIDKDPEAEIAAKEIAANDSRFIFKLGSFTLLKKFVDELKWHGKVQGILLDLGVSSPQLENPKRGFSFLQEGPLDMRMNPNQGISAEKWINLATDQEIARVLKDYGEERFAKRIAKAIIQARQIQPIITTRQLADIITNAQPFQRRHKHPATRSFQAIRIFINQELEELASVLSQCVEILAIGGRLLAISFHSLEDRMVKRFIQREEKGDPSWIHLPIPPASSALRLKRIAVIKPSEEEIMRNPRSRSAILRVAEKIA